MKMFHEFTKAEEPSFVCSGFYVACIFCSIVWR